MRNFWTGFFGIIYLLPFLLTLMGSLAPFIPVDILTPIQLIPPFLTLSVILHVLFLVFFLTRSFRWSIIAAIGLGLSGWAATKEIRPFAQSPEPTGEVQLKVVSYNVASFAYEARQVERVTDVLKKINADVVALQEFRYQQLAEARFALEKIAQDLQMPYYRFDHRPETLHGAATFSRYPILQVDTLFMEPGEINTGIITTIHAPMGRVGIGNIHLTSFKLKKKLEEKMSFWEKVKRLFVHAQKVVKNQQEKVEQVQKGISQYPYPLIVAGDLNAAPHSRIIHQFQDLFQDSFYQAGKGRGFSYPVFGPYGLRIDYQFSTPDLLVLSHEIVREGASDHYPVLVCYGWTP